MVVFDYKLNYLIVPSLALEIRKLLKLFDFIRINLTKRLHVPDVMLKSRRFNSFANLILFRLAII